jgi:hypothetical protein
VGIVVVEKSSTLALAEHDFVVTAGFGKSYNDLGGVNKVRSFLGT